MIFSGFCFAMLCSNMFPSNATSYKALEKANKEIDNKREDCIKRGMKLDMDAYFGMKAACDIARFCKADYFNWDGDGLGATLRDHATQYLAGLKIQLNMFRGSNSVDAPDAIYNWQNKGAGTKNEPIPTKRLTAPRM